MQRLSRDRHAFEQIREAVKSGERLVFWLSRERAGDKAASVGVAEWIADTVGADITIIESEGNPVTDFRLRDYILPHRLHVETQFDESEVEGFDCHSMGTGLDVLWLLVPHCSALGYRGELRIKNAQKYTDEVLFCLLTDTTYNERRDMSGECARATVDRLRDEGYNVQVIALGPQELFPEALHLPMSECVERIALASCVIAGDSGFSHVGAAFGTPLVSLYPDWSAHGMTALTPAIQAAEWWEINCQDTPIQFFPNAPFERRCIVQIETNHEWSIEHVVRAVNKVKR